MMPTDLAGARVLVIGGSSGIGLATAAGALAAGARVTLASRNAQRLAAAAASLAGARTRVLDVSSDAAVCEFFGDGDEWTHVVLAGSATQTGGVRSLPISAARASMDNKFWGAYHVGRYARVAAGGSITFVSGVYSQRPQPDAVLQGALNAAVEALARGLALELAPAIRVNTVSPSTTVTPLWDKLGAAGREQKFEQMRARLPLGRVADADDIAQAILFMMTNRFATGSTLLVDGGDALV